MQHTGVHNRAIGALKGDDLRPSESSTTTTNSLPETRSFQFKSRFEKIKRKAAIQRTKRWIEIEAEVKGRIEVRMKNVGNRKVGGMAERSKSSGTSNGGERAGLGKLGC